MNYEFDKNYLIFKNSRFYSCFNSLVEEVKCLKSIGVEFFFFQTPVASRIDSLSDFEMYRIKEWKFDFNNISGKDCTIIKQIYPEDISIEYLQAVYDGVKVFERNGIRYLSDFESRYVNIINGRRVTYYQPQIYVNKIYMFGQCTLRGTGVEDKDTIASVLQRLVNHKYPNSYKVENEAIGCGSDLHDDIAHLKEIRFKKGDIVILCTNLEIIPKYLLKKYNIDSYDCSTLFERPHLYGEWFTDLPVHTNEIGNNVIGQYIYSMLERKCLSLKENVYCFDNYNQKSNTFHVDDKEIEKYLCRVSNGWNKEGECGSIVMNCNPFTLGHLYLIETAARQVDKLCIFIVEENKSFFSFEDRIELVKRGTRHLKNLHIIPSGKYIISAVTFPGYFYKDGNTEIEIDTSKDVNIFGKYIAPRMGISKRFVGNEPNDYVTRTYNETLKKMLPQYNVQVIEIPRKKENGKVISASLVRKYLEVKDFDEIMRLVPKSTYDYLKDKYG